MISFHALGSARLTVDETYEGGATVGVADVARLISRLRQRQFGVFVTTSVVARQAYKEVRILPARKGALVRFVLIRVLSRFPLRKAS